jgi:predicted metal-dependent peptidase
MNDLQRRLSAAQLRLRSSHPFFASLALFAPIKITEKVETAATDGRDVYFNPQFLSKLSNPEVDGVLLHEVLHAALLHVTRRGQRDPVRWNFAADIVVNAMVSEQGLALPPDAVQRDKWAERSVEEIYDLLRKSKTRTPRKLMLDLRDDLAGEGTGGAEDGAVQDRRRSELTAHWKMARQQAHVIARRTKWRGIKGQGTGASEMGLEWELLDHPQIDWRAELWRYLVQTPVDYSGYDRRFVYRGLYVDAMVGESLILWVAIDTSGSISPEELNTFGTELLGILRAYPSIRCQLYFADYDLHGPYDLTGDEQMPQPQGGGGTSFVPFFEALDACQDAEKPYVCLYLTDGYGNFPEEDPEVPTLWLVTSGGLPAREFPFGKVVRLIDE